MIAIFVAGCQIIPQEPSKNEVEEKQPVPIKEQTVTDKEPEKPEEQAGLANPASVYCAEQEGTLELRQSKDGGQYSVCIFADGSECEQWDYFRGECEKGESLGKGLWKTYKNEKHNIELKYPKNLEIQESKVTTNGIMLNFNLYNGQNRVFHLGTADLGMEGHMRLYTIEGTEKEVLVNGIKASQFKITNQKAGFPIQQTIIKKYDKLYVLVGEGEVFDEILSTVKFIDSGKKDQATTTLTDWNSFTHKSHNYTVKFPKNWHWDGTDVNVLVISAEAIESPDEKLTKNNLKILTANQEIIEKILEDNLETDIKIVSLGEKFKAVYLKNHNYKDIVDQIISSFEISVEEETENIF